MSDDSTPIEEYPKRIYVDGITVTVANATEEARYRTPAVTRPTPKVAPSHTPEPHPYAKKPILHGGKKK